MENICWNSGIPSVNGPWRSYPEGVVAVANVAAGSFLVVYADSYTGQVHTYLDLWVGDQQVASSDDRETWPLLERWFPKEQWPISAFWWVSESDLPISVQLERWASDLAGRQFPLAA